jgi:hypothetical protein
VSRSPTAPLKWYKCGGKNLSKLILPIENENLVLYLVLQHDITDSNKRYPSEKSGFGTIFMKHLLLTT